MVGAGIFFSLSAPQHFLIFCLNNQNESSVFSNTSYHFLTVKFKPKQIACTDYMFYEFV